MSSESIEGDRGCGIGTVDGLEIARDWGDCFATFATGEASYGERGLTAGETTWNGFPSVHLGSSNASRTGPVGGVNFWSVYPMESTFLRSGVSTIPLFFTGDG